MEIKNIKNGSAIKNGHFNGSCHYKWPFLMALPLKMAIIYGKINGH
jgi:hypothetical protein